MAEMRHRALTSELPQIEGAQTLGRMDDQSMLVPSDYERLVSYTAQDSNAESPNRFFPVREFGLEDRANLAVIGRTATDFILTIYNYGSGQPVYAISKADLVARGFVEADFNWGKTDEKNFKG